MINTEISHFVLPTAPVKTLWFDFWYQNDLLEKHLEQRNCDPTPIELMIQFLTTANATSSFQSNGQSGAINQENEADSNRDTKEKKSSALRILTLKVAAFLKWDLELLESKLPMTMQLIIVEELRKMCQASECQNFADILYHRWILRSLTKASYPIRNPKIQSLAIPILQQIDPSYISYDLMHSLISKLHEEILNSLTQLERLLTEIKTAKIACPSIKCFGVRTVGSKPSVNWKEAEKLDSKTIKSIIMYELGKYYFIRDVEYGRALKLFQKILVPPKREEKNLKGYIEACQKMINCPEFDIENETLITPFKYLENVQKGQTCDTLNLEKNSSWDQIFPELKDSKSKPVNHLSLYLKTRVAGISSMAAPDTDKHEFQGDEDDGEGFLSAEQLILTATDPEQILNLSCQITVPSYDLNSSWKVPDLLMNCIQSLPGQQFLRCQVLLAKADELRRSQLYTESRTLYLSVQEEMQALIPALSQLLPSIILETDLEAFLESNDVDQRRLTDLLEKCRNSLISERIVSELSPSIIEIACVFLLDNFDPHLKHFFNCPNPIIRLASLLYSVTKEMSVPKTFKELWECLIVALCETTSEIKRLKPGPKTATLSLESFSSFLKKLRNPQVIAVITSGLIRMHNLVKDSSSNEMSSIVTPQPVLWPVSLSVSQVMPDLEIISAVLKQALSQSLEIRSDDTTYIKCRAELQLIEGHLADSLKNFLLVLSILTDNFTVFNGSPEEEYAINKMIIITTKMGCHTCSAILQQMVSQPNYSLAFKSLCERSCSDSADHLYDFFWDVNMIEYLVNLHTKRGDLERKLRAVQLISKLDLNANNAPEIMREAANVRKRQFFGVLCKKYM